MPQAVEKKKLGQILVERRLITADQLQRALEGDFVVDLATRLDLTGHLFVTEVEDRDERRRADEQAQRGAITAIAAWQGHRPWATGIPPAP